MASRIDAIRNARVVLNEKETARVNAVDNINNKAIAKIKTYADDFKELYEIAEELLNNGFTLGKTDYLCFAPHFVSEGWAHRVGFMGNCNYFSQEVTLKGAFGIVNGGACGDIDLVIDLNGNIKSYGEVYSSGEMVDVRRFANDFPKFKEEFLAYVDEICKA